MGQRFATMKRSPSDLDNGGELLSFSIGGEGWSDDISFERYSRNSWVSPSAGARTSPPANAKRTYQKSEVGFYITFDDAIALRDFLNRYIEDNLNEH